MPSKLIVGLGNPGLMYQNTWHNAGFWVVDHIALKKNCSFQKGSGDFLVSSFHSPTKVYLIKPTTFMNLSGIAVSQALNFYKIQLEDLLVVFDDHDLWLGTIRIRASGSDGGHKGMKSIIEQLKTNQFSRLRIGIRIDVENRRKHLAHQVLSEPPLTLREEINQIIERASFVVDYFIENGISKTMNQFNIRKKKPVDDTLGEENSSATPKVE
ncbi:MAG: aminoacyl-tRNA hydrolase [bacterium]|nr:aminoacyl-tRNA hydrolase [bacterium]